MPRALLPPVALAPPHWPAVPPPQNDDNLTAAEFDRRREAMPADTRALVANNLPSAFATLTVSMATPADAAFAADLVRRLATLA